MGSCISLRASDSQAMLAASFLGTTLLGIDLRDMCQLIEQEKVPTGACLTLENKHLMLVLGGTVSVQDGLGTNGSSKRELATFHKGDVIPAFLLAPKPPASVFFVPRGSGKVEPKFASITTLAMQQFLTKRPYLAVFKNIATALELSALPIFAKVPKEEILILCSMVTLAAFDSHDEVVQFPASEEDPLKGCTGIVLRGALKPVAVPAVAPPMSKKKGKSLSNMFAGSKAKPKDTPMTLVTMRMSSEAVKAGSVVALDTTMAYRGIIREKYKCCEDATVIALIRKNVMESIEKCLPKLYQSLREEFTFRLLWGIEGVTRYLRTASELTLRKVAGSSIPLCVTMNTEICRQNDPAPPSVYVVIDGLLKCSVKLEEGKSIQTRTMRPGDLIGEIAVIAEASTCPFTLTVTSQTAVVIQIPGPIFREVFGTFNTLMDQDADSRIRADGVKCKLTDILYHRAGYDRFLQFVSSELAVENLLYWRICEQCMDILARVEYRYLEEHKHLKVDDKLDMKPVDKFSQSMSWAISDEGEARGESSMVGLSVGGASEADNSASYLLDIEMLSFKELVTRILNVYLRVGSQHEVNIAGKHREELLEMFTQFIPECTTMFVWFLRWKFTSEGHRSTLPPAVQSAAQLWVQLRQQFGDSQREVFKLLDSGSFVRWKATDQFKQYMDR